MTRPAQPLTDFNLRAALQNGLTFGDNLLAAWVEIPGCVHGQEAVWKNSLPRGTKPIAFWAREAVDVAGNRLQLVGDPTFNPLPVGGDGKLRDGFFGITPQYSAPLGSCRAMSAVNVSIAHNAYTDVTWDTAVQSGSISWVVGSPTRITCAVAGRVSVTHGSLFDTAAGGVRIASVFKGGVGEFYAYSAIPGGDYAGPSGADEFDVSAGDYLTLAVLQNKTAVGALNLLADHQRLHLSARYVGPPSTQTATISGLLVGG